MFHTAEEVILYMQSKQNKRSHLELTQIQSMFAAHGNFQLRYPTVHIAGTNGKGSTTNFISEVLLASGYNVGMYTSPFYEVHQDRIRYNGQYIPDEWLVRIANQYHGDFEAFDLTFFEIDTFICLRYFYEMKVDIAVIEVGLGGRLDATNVILPEVSVITNIGFDHMEYLGDTLAKIAFEKAGIIKPKVPVVIGCDCVEDSVHVFKDVAKQRQAPFSQAPMPENVEITDHTEFTFRGHRYHLSSLATYQPKNAVLALSALNILQAKGWKITPQAIEQGLYKAHWRGRFEPIHQHPDWFVDGAHNFHGMTALLETLRTYVQQGRHIRVLFAALKDKPTDQMIEGLLTVTNDVTVSEFPHYRIKKAIDLAGHHPVKIVSDYRQLLDQWMKETNSNDLFLITGSLYFLTQVTHYLKERGWAK